VCELIKMI